jgi:hypothetical protein
MKNSEKTHCKKGHPLFGENLLIDKRGFRGCRACLKQAKQESFRRNRDAINEKRSKRVRALRRAGQHRHGYTANVTRSFSREQVEQAIEAVRETKKLAAVSEVLGPWKGKAFLFFNPKLKAQLKKLTVRSSTLISRPAIVATHSNALRVLDLIAAAVPRSLPRDQRDDIISNITLAVLEGRLKQSQIACQVKEFIRASFRDDHNRWGDVSLDVPIGHDVESAPRINFIRDDQRLWGP